MGFEPTTTGMGSRSHGLPDVIPNADRSVSPPSSYTESYTSPPVSADLARVVEAWPHLDADARRAILAVVEGADPKRRSPPSASPHSRGAGAANIMVNPS